MKLVPFYPGADNVDGSQQMKHGSQGLLHLDQHASESDPAFKFGQRLSLLEKWSGVYSNHPEWLRQSGHSALSVRCAL